MKTFDNFLDTPQFEESIVIADNKQNKNKIRYIEENIYNNIYIKKNKKNDKYLRVVFNNVVCKYRIDHYSKEHKQDFDYLFNKVESKLNANTKLEDIKYSQNTKKLIITLWLTDKEDNRIGNIDLIIKNVFFSLEDHVLKHSLWSFYNTQPNVLQTNSLKDIILNIISDYEDYPPPHGKNIKIKLC